MTGRVAPRRISTALKTDVALDSCSEMLTLEFMVKDPLSSGPRYPKFYLQSFLGSIFRIDRPLLMDTNLTKEGATWLKVSDRSVYNNICFDGKIIILQF